MNLPSSESLRGRVAVVAGATRGAGRGIAAALGEAGATVICTGRSSTNAGSSMRSDYDRPETIEETAELVTRLGGKGIAIAVDHLECIQVAALAERIRAEHGRIDVLVNDIWGGEVLKGGPPQWNTPIWKLDLQKGLRIMLLGIETHLVTSHYLLPLLVAQPGGLLVEVTDGTADYNAQNYRISVFYDLVKQSVNRLAFSQGHELAPHGATAVAVRLAALGNDAGEFRRQRSELARGADGAGRPASGAAGFRALGIAALRRPRRRGAGCRFRAGQVESEVGQLRRTRAALRLYGCRWLAP
jgi:NAD(P)-dependent dehydrogenase (short-subunit alcohol dehydrogenase family)